MVLAANLLDHSGGLGSHFLDLGEVAIGKESGLDHPGATSGNDGLRAQELGQVLEVTPPVGMKR